MEDLVDTKSDMVVGVVLDIKVPFLEDDFFDVFNLRR